MEKQSSVVGDGKRSVRQRLLQQSIRIFPQMPDRSLLRVGDCIRLLTVPSCDLAQRQRELAADAEMAGWTADTIERIIAADPVVTIERINEYGAAWFEVELPGGDGMDYHSVVILDDDSWERCL